MGPTGCVLEVKLMVLGAPERALALEEGWDSYFSLCRVRTNSTSHGRYSGVATFCRTSCRPRMAEEGVTGELAPAPGGVGHTARVNEAFGPSRLQELDGEGRGVLDAARIRSNARVRCAARSWPVGLDAVSDGLHRQKSIHSHSG